MNYLAKTLGLRQIGYRDRITVRAPDADGGSLFQRASDGRVRVFQIIRTAFDGRHTPIRVTVTVFPADRNQFIFNVGEVPELLPSPDESGPGS